MKLTLISKTDINTDARILNQIDILLKEFPALQIDFILLPDKPVEITLDSRVRLHEVKCLVRHRRWLRFYTGLEFTFKSLLLLKSLEATKIHTHDSSVALPVLLFKLFFPSTTIIYDDHEIPNENISIFRKINVYIENQLIKRSKLLIEANEERLQYISTKLNLKEDHKKIYFQNLHLEDYFVDSNIVSSNISVHLELIEKDLENGTRFILHQGPLLKERGRDLIAALSTILKPNYKILLIGGTLAGFQGFLKEYNLSGDSFLFVGTVNYKYLPLFWRKALLSLIVYLPRFANNRFCAPNRFYMSILCGVPAIVNASNPVLNNFIKKYNNGYFVEDILNRGLPVEEEVGRKKESFSVLYSSLVAERAKTFIGAYRILLSQR